MFFQDWGHDSNICFKGFIYEAISEKLSTNKPKTIREEIKIIWDAAAFILDIRSIPYETNKYPPSDNFLNDVQTVVQVTLSVLLSDIICKLTIDVFWYTNMAPQTSSMNTN